MAKSSFNEKSRTAYNMKADDYDNTPCDELDRKVGLR